MSEAPWRSTLPAWKAFGLQAEAALTREFGGEHAILAYSLARPANLVGFFFLVLFLTLAGVIGVIAAFVASVYAFGPIAAGIGATIFVAWLATGWIYLWARLFIEWGAAARLKVGDVSKVVLPIFLLLFAPIGALIGAILIIMEITGGPNTLVARTKSHFVILRMRPVVLIPRFGAITLFSLDNTRISSGPQGLLTYPLSIESAGSKTVKLSVFKNLIGLGLIEKFAHQNAEVLVSGVPAAEPPTPHTSADAPAAESRPPGTSDVLPLQSLWSGLRIAFVVYVALTILDAIVSASELADEPLQAVAAPASILYLVATLWTAYLFLKLTYRAMKNLHVSGVPSLTVSPGWAVAWYFIPIAWLWMPLKAVREIWRGSANPEDPSSARVPGAIGWWWLAWLTAGVSGYASFRLVLEDEFEAASTLAIVSDVSGIAGVVLAASFWGDIVKLQDNRREVRASAQPTVLAR